MKHTRDRNTQRVMVLILVTCVLWLTGTVCSDAQTNITPTQGDLSLGTTVTTNGNTTVITGGTQPVGNTPFLFHSFGRFDLKAGEVAQFQNGGIQAPALITDIFARVIGGRASQIDGTIQTTGPNGFGTANLWFMNPSGILFGPNASLNIGGSANFTTADSISASNSSFSSNTTQKTINSSSFSFGDVTSFGFFSSGKEIAIDRSNLKVPAGTLAFVGGDVKVTGGKLEAPLGVIRITSLDTSGSCDPVCGIVNRNTDSGNHSYGSGVRGLISLGQGDNGVDLAINSGGIIQLNTDTYSGTNTTDFNGALAGPPPMIKIQDGSLVVANLPRVQLVVSSPAVKSLTPNTTLDVGDNGNLDVTLNHAFIKPVDVQVASIDPTIASIAPSDLTVPAGKNTAQVQAQGLAPGNTSVRAAIRDDIFPASSATATVVVNPVLPPLDSTLNPTPTTLVEGNRGTVTVTLNQPASQDIQVTFTSSNPAVLTAPTSVTIPKGGTSVNASYATLQPGSATVTATLLTGTSPLDTATSGPIAVNPLQLTTLSPNLTIQEGESGTLTLTLSQPAPRPIPVTFTSSNPTDVPAPAATTVPEGQRSIPVLVRGADDGRAIITASYAGDTAVATVIVTLPTIPFDSTLNPTPTTLVEGNRGTVTVTLNQPASQDIQVTFTSSNPTVLTAPTPVTIRAGQTSENGSYTTLQPGAATVTASLQTGTTVLDTAVSPTIRVNPLQLTTLSPNLTIQEGESGTLTLTLSQEAPRDIPVTFTSSNPADVPAPAPITVAEGARTVRVPVRGADDGRAIITASYAGDTAVATVVVNPIPPPSTPPPSTPPGSTGNSNGQSVVSNAVASKTPADSKLVQPIPSPPPSRLVIASDRCSGGLKGEFSSFVQGGRDASRTQPGGLLASPLGFEDETPQISSITIQPGELSVRAIGPLNVAPAAMAFLQRGGGC